MKASEALNNIWYTYQVTDDCLKIAKRSVALEDLRLLKKTSFITSSLDKATQDITDIRNNVDDYVILSLWVVFERNLFEYCFIENQRLLNNNSNDLTQRVYEKINNEIEYWRVDDVLDMFKPFVDSQIIGQAKQIKKYRDWIAHKNPKKAIPQSITPKMAHRVLLTIVQILEENQMLSS